MRRLLDNLPQLTSADPHKIIRRGFLRLKSPFRAGNPISRVFRRVFEHKRLRAVLGSNIVALVFAASFIPATSTDYFNDFSAEDSLVLSQRIEFATEKGVQYPLEEVYINQGYRVYHPGIDFEGVTGDPVRPIMNGTIESVQYSNYAYGNAIIVRHSDGLSSLYAHLSKILVRPEDFVNTHSVIGLVGSTGYSSGDHLHLEIRSNGYPINPFIVLPQL